MKKRTHLYVDNKNLFTWIMVLLMSASVIFRIYLTFRYGVPSSNIFWRVVFPVLSSLLYVLICLIHGKEFFFKTSVPVSLFCIYLAIVISSYSFGRLTIFSLDVCLFFYAFGYYLYTSHHANRVSILTILTITLLAAVCYFIFWGDFSVAGSNDLWFIPDILVFTGWLMMLLGLQVHPADEYHPTWGDRSDGRRIRSQPPMDQVSPYIMVTRNSANNLFEDSIEISHVERYIRKKRKEGYAGFGINHVLLATFVRCIAEYPALNRFIAGQKVYTHGNDIQYCMTVKKEMRIDSPDTIIKLHLDPKDTANDVYDKFNKAVEEVRNTPLDSSFDNVAHIFTMVPGVFLKFLVWFLKFLDYFGLIPAFLLEVSPFHGSVFFTSMGSLGIPPVFHHLYDFGNLPIFAAFGCKYHKFELNENGEVLEKRYVDIKFNVDERIVDGYYYASFFKYFKRILAHPEQLDNPPDRVVEDID